MTTTSISPDDKKPASRSQSQDGDVMFRRREKRRHLNSNSIDIRDPYLVIALAVRYDESLASDSDEILKVPLESGPIYNQKAFARALQELEAKTAVPRRGNSSSNNIEEAGDGEKPGRKAIAPVILSGLVAAIQERAEKNGAPSAVDLVAYCRRMRRAALSRHRLRKRRQHIQKHVTPFIILFILVGFVLWSAFSVRTSMIKHQFLGSEEVAICQENRPCRMASANVWKYVDPSNRLVVPECTHKECKAEEGQLEYPFYVLHTLLQRDFISLTELEKPRNPRRIVWPYRRYSKSMDSTPLRWLGETIVTRLVQEAIQAYHPATASVTILDCGCGVGGLAYALQSGSGLLLSSKSSSRSLLRYHGIALSAPEIYLAQSFQEQHDFYQTTNMEISFEQHDFNDPLGISHQYSVVVAVESLSFGSDLRAALKNLVQSAKKDGIFIFVEDMINPWVSKERVAELRDSLGKPSLGRFVDWQMNLEDSKLELLQVIDLSVEYDMSELLVHRGVESSNFMKKLVDIRYRIAERLSDYMGYLLGSKAKNPNAAVQLMKLARNLAEVNMAALARKQGYQGAELSYYLMVAKVK